MRVVLISALTTLLLACSSAPTDAPASGAPAREDITLGNGEDNSIDVSGLTRDGSTFTVKQVTVAKASYLVLHEFKDGKPDGKDYVAATYLPAGTHTDVEITVGRPVSSGEPFLIMLHEDVDNDQVFDFIFVDERNVEDRAVFEGTTMIAHIIQAP
ncbi:MAG: hypothetical protein HRU11_04165 [Parvularculaceae bacterium]|nr:hypothetical protein [Parvularculaceae bacterium]